MLTWESFCKYDQDMKCEKINHCTIFNSPLHIFDLSLYELVITAPQINSWVIMAL